MATLKELLDEYNRKERAKSISDLVAPKQRLADEIPREPNKPSKSRYTTDAKGRLVGRYDIIQADQNRLAQEGLAATPDETPEQKAERIRRINASLPKSAGAGNADEIFDRMMKSTSKGGKLALFRRAMQVDPNKAEQLLLDEDLGFSEKQVSDLLDETQGVLQEKVKATRARSDLGASERADDFMAGITERQALRADLEEEQAAIEGLTDPTDIANALSNLQKQREDRKALAEEEQAAREDANRLRNRGGGEAAARESLNEPTALDRRLENQQEINRKARLERQLREELDAEGGGDVLPAVDVDPSQLRRPDLREEVKQAEVPTEQVSTEGLDQIPARGETMNLVQVRAIEELARRGKLNPIQKKAYQELVRRGAIRDVNAKTPPPKNTEPGGAFLDAVKSFNNSFEDLPLGTLQFIGRLIGSENVEEAVQKVKAKNMEQQQVLDERSPVASTVGKVAGAITPAAIAAPLSAPTAAGRIALAGGVGSALAAGQVTEREKSKTAQIVQGGVLGALLGGAIEGVAAAGKGVARALRPSAKLAEGIDDVALKEALDAQQRLASAGLPNAKLTPGQASGDRFVALREQAALARAGDEAGKAAIARVKEQGKFANESIAFVKDKILGGQSKENLDKFVKAAYSEVDDIPIPQESIQGLIAKNPTTFKKIAADMKANTGVWDDILKGNIKPNTVGEVRVFRQALGEAVQKEFKSGNKSNALALKKMIGEIDNLIEPVAGAKFKAANKAYEVMQLTRQLEIKMSKVAPKLAQGEYAPSQIYNQLFAKSKDFDELLSIAGRADPALVQQLKDVRLVLQRIGLTNLDLAARAATKTGSAILEPSNIASIGNIARTALDKGAAAVGAKTINQAIIDMAFNPKFGKILASLKKEKSRQAITTVFSQMLRNYARHTAEGAPAMATPNPYKDK